MRLGNSSRIETKNTVKHSQRPSIPMKDWKSEPRTRIEKTGRRSVVQREWLHARNQLQAGCPDSRATCPQRPANNKEGSGGGERRGRQSERNGRAIAFTGSGTRESYLHLRTQSRGDDTSGGTRSRENGPVDRGAVGVGVGAAPGRVNAVTYAACRFL